jgi:hypothetical protein
MRFMGKVAIKVADIPKDEIKEHEGVKYLHCDIYVDTDKPGKYGAVGSLSVYMGKDTPKVYIGNIKPSENAPKPNKPTTSQVRETLGPLEVEDDLPF